MAQAVPFSLALIHLGILQFRMFGYKILTIV
jgi:hypothetical protein